MGQTLAKQDDQVIATDTHLVRVGKSYVPLPHPFNGIIDGGLSADVNVMGKPAATVNSTATNTPAHTPTSPGSSFLRPPKDEATIIAGSGSVFINGKPAARNNDTALTCNDPADLPVGTVVAVGTVKAGG